VNKVYNIWEQQKDQNMRYKVPDPEYPEEYLDYPGKSGISGFIPGVSGFSQAPENWTALESILVTRFVHRRIRSLIN
jgi:hypothetical protein